MKIRLASPLQTDSIVDGEGIRTVIWTQGCSHNCPGCHNPETHDFTAGYEIDTKEIEEKIAMLNGQTGITLSGGDPFFQAKACGQIAHYAKTHTLTIWCYTGFTFEQLEKQSQNNPDIAFLLQQIDVLVDGKFEEENRSLTLYFRGSSNQRILDLPKSLAMHAPILIEKYAKQNATSLGYSNMDTIKGGIFI